jgi:hypothetical protein
MNASSPTSALYSHTSVPVNTEPVNIPHFVEVNAPKAVPLTAGYVDIPCSIFTDPRLSDFARTMLCYLLCTSRPGVPLVEVQHKLLAGLYECCEDKIHTAMTLITKLEYVTRTRQKREDGALQNYIYDVTPTLLLLPDTQSDFRRTGGKSDHSQTSEKGSPILNPVNKDVSKNYVCKEHKHQKTSLMKPFGKPDVVIKLSKEEEDTVNALKAIGEKITAESFVKKYGIGRCRQVMEWYKNYPGSKTPGLLIKCLKEEYPIEGTSFDSKNSAPASKPAPQPRTVPVKAPHATEKPATVSGGVITPPSPTQEAEKGSRYDAFMANLAARVTTDDVKPTGRERDRKPRTASTPDVPEESLEQIRTALAAQFNPNHPSLKKSKVAADRGYSAALEDYYPPQEEIEEMEMARYAME